VKGIVALLAIFALGGSTIANATPLEGADSYIGYQFGSSDVTIDGASDLDLDLTLFQLGVWVSDEISVEVRTGQGGNDDTVQGVDFEIEALYGMYGLYHFNFSDFASVYGAVGLSRLTLKASGAGGSVQEDENGLSYGVGAKLSIFSFEFMRYMDNNEVEADVVSVGLQYTFH
jgi:hypothetical protein